MGTSCRTRCRPGLSVWTTRTTTSSAKSTTDTPRSAPNSTAPGSPSYQPARKRSDAKQKELQALLMSQGRYRGPPLAPPRSRTLEVQPRLGFQEHESRARVRAAIAGQPNYEFEAIEDKSLLRELPEWRSTHKEQWKTKTGFHATLTGNEGWPCPPSHPPGAEPYFDGL